MKETLRLSDAPIFRQILTAYALRLNPDLRLDRLVLANISTTLTYWDGQTFTYTLDPANFAVEDLDEAEREISPINGSSQARLLIYSIRDVDGTWHRPIGTTCIFKDILKIEGRNLKETELDLLNSLHQVKQQRLLEDSGDDLRAYGHKNGLHEAMLTPAYLQALGHDDPIRDHLRRLLEERAPFSREALKTLRAHARQHSEAEIHTLSKQAQEKPRLAAPPAEDSPFHNQRPRKLQVKIDPDVRVLSQAVLSDLRPHQAWILEHLPQMLHPDLASVFESSFDPVPVTLVLHDALQELAGETLSAYECQSRGKTRFEPSHLEALQHAWPEAEPYLTDFTPLGRRLLRDRLMTGRLTSHEASALFDARRASQPVINPERKLYSAAAQEHAARLAVPLRLHLEPGDEALVDRLERRRLLISDAPRLDWYRSQISRTALPREVRQRFSQTSLLGKVQPHLQADFEVALRLNTFPDHLRAEFERVVDEADLDATTMWPNQLPDGHRALLLDHWEQFESSLRTVALWSALEANRYTREQREQLTAIAHQPLRASAVLPEDRERLLNTVADWRSELRPELFSVCLEALHTESYPVWVVDRLPKLLACVEHAQQARERHQLEALEGTARHLFDRLLRRWDSMNPRRARWLKSATHHALLEHCPEACLQFQSEGIITVDFENSVWEHLTGKSVPA